MTKQQWRCWPAPADAFARAGTSSRWRFTACRIVTIRKAKARFAYRSASPNKPVIAAVDGYCVAGGLELALWCDLRVAEADAVFGVFCRRCGVPLIDGGTIRLPG